MVCCRWLADPSHAIKSFGKDAYKEFPNTRKRDKGLAEWLKKCFSYAVRQNRESGDIHATHQAIHVAINGHCYGNHKNCGNWCRRKEGGWTRRSCRELKSEDRAKTDAMLKKHASMARVKELMHSCSTQRNEAMNKAYSATAPKIGVDFGATGSYGYRVAIAIGSKNLGVVDFTELVYQDAEVPFTSIQRTMFHAEDKKKGRWRALARTRKAKSCRKYKFLARSIEKIAQEEKSSGGYGPGIAMEMVTVAGATCGDPEAAEGLTTVLNDSAITTNSREKRPRRCGNCGDVGHDARSCPKEKGPDVMKLEYTEMVMRGDLLVLWDLEATSKNASVAEPVDICYMAMKVDINENRGLDVIKVNDGIFESLIRPTNGQSTSFLRDHGITDMMLEAAGSLVSVVDKADEAILRFAAGVGELKSTRVWLVGHNANSYDNTVMFFSLQRQGGRGWLERLESCGVIGFIDTLSMLGGGFNALKGQGVNGRNGKSLTSVHELVTGKSLEGAHRAKADVEGLGRIIMESASMKECLFTKKVGLTTKTWAMRKQQQIARNAWKASRDDQNSSKEPLNEMAP